MKKILVLSLCAAVLSACSSTKSSVSASGTTDNPVFPSVDSVQFDNNRGTFPTADELANVKAGMTKDQYYKLLGRPHFDEGFWGVREWDYLFHFHTPGQGTNNVTTCQFKILYDDNYISQSFFWKPIDPPQAICPPFSQPQEQQNPQRYTLNADALFAFDKSELSPQGRAELTEFARKVIRFDRLRAIHIEGHTDYLGADNYNQSLSERRAQTVMRYLTQLGLPGGVMSAVGYGETRPVTQCTDSGNRNALIACLQPNRRVEVIVDGSGQL
ncbi:MAG: OmpA family protein [Cardiobacteriaceae bacterium]|nr:OmpA family protein [Cardiobacteriaceae bacterium]